MKIAILQGKESQKMKERGDLIQASEKREMIVIRKTHTLKLLRYFQQKRLRS